MRRRRGSSPGEGAANAPASSPAAATAPAAAAAPAPRPAAPAARPRGAGGSRPRLPPQLQSLLPHAASPAPAPPLAPAQPARYALLVCTVPSGAAGARSAVAAAAQQLAGAAAADAAAAPHRSGWPAQLLPRPRVLWHLAGLPSAEAAPVPPAPLWLPSSAAHAALLRAAAHCAAPEPPAAPAAAACGTAVASAVAAACAAVPRGALCDALWLCDDARCDSDAAAAVAAALLAARDAHGERLCTTLLSVVSSDGDAASSPQAGPARDLAEALSARLVLVPAAPPRPASVPDAASPGGWGRPVALPPPLPLLPLLLDSTVLWRGALCFPDPRRGAAAATGAAQGGRGAGPERPLRGLAALALPLTAVLPAADAPEPGVRYDGLQICADETPLAGAARCARLRSASGSIATLLETMLQRFAYFPPRAPRSLSDCDHAAVRAWAASTAAASAGQPGPAVPAESAACAALSSAWSVTRVAPLAQLLPACVLAPAPPLRLSLAPGAPPATAALLSGWAALSAEGTPVAFLARPASAGDAAPQLALWHAGGAFHASRLPSSGEAARAYYPGAFADTSTLDDPDEAAMPSDADALAALRAFAELPVLRGSADVEAVLRGWDAPRPRHGALHRTTAAAADAGASAATAAAACYARAKWDAMTPGDDDAAAMLAGAPAEDAAHAGVQQSASALATLASRPAFAPRTLVAALGEGVGVGGVAARVRYDVALRLRYPPDGQAPPARPKHRSQKAKAGGGGAKEAAVDAAAGAKARAPKRPRDADEVTSGPHGGEPRRARRSLAGALPPAPKPREPAPPVAAPRPPAATILYPAQRRRADGRLLLERATAAAGAAGGAAPAKPAQLAAPSAAVASAQPASASKPAPASASKAAVPASASKAAAAPASASKAVPVPPAPAAGASRVNRFLRIPTAELPPALQAALASDGVAPVAPAPPAPVQAVLACPTADCDMAPPADPRARFCMGCGAMLLRPGA